jgi:hypothetical protein
MPTKPGTRGRVPARDGFRTVPKQSPVRSRRAGCRTLLLYLLISTYVFKCRRRYASGWLRRVARISCLATPSSSGDQRAYEAGGRRALLGANRPAGGLALTGQALNHAGRSLAVGRRLVADEAALGRVRVNIRPRNPNGHRPLGRSADETSRCGAQPSAARAEAARTQNDSARRCQPPAEPRASQSKTVWLRSNACPVKTCSNSALHKFRSRVRFLANA